MQARLISRTRWLILLILFLQIIAVVIVGQNQQKHYLIGFQPIAVSDPIPAWNGIIAEGQRIKVAREEAARVELANRQEDLRRASRRRTNYTPGVASGDAWGCIRANESGGKTNTAGNYSDPKGGAYQFLDSTWSGLDGNTKDGGYHGYPNAESAPPAEQDAAAIKLQQRSGWGQWTTAAGCGLL